MDVTAAILAFGAAACGTVRREALLPYMTDAQRTRLQTLVPDWQRVVVAAYPYYVDTPAPSPALSRYAWGMDYHKVLTDALTPAAETLRSAGYRATVLADASPVPERAAACLAGLGVLGRNGLVLLPEYGSYVFLGSIVTDAALDAADHPIQSCENCGACIAACPTGALHADGYDMERCLSHISQKKGVLSPVEEAALRENHCLWGCDACQTSCPHNHAPRETTIPAFREHLIKTLRAEDLAHHTNRSFQSAYGDRAFAWRGPAVLRRNLDILEKKETES